MTSGMRIGPLTSAHRGRIEEIVRATNVFSADELAVAMEVFDSAVAGTERGGIEPDYTALGAFRDDELLGYACFGPTPATDRTWDLYWIAVHPDAQRSGAGQALMDAVEAALASRRARLLVIETSSRADYAPTRLFYEKRGYAQAARLPDFYAPGDDRLVLTRRLDAVPSPGGPDRTPLSAPRP